MPTNSTATEPAIREPESSFRLNPLRQVRFLYTGFVQGLFYAQPRGSYHWELDPQDSEIIITSESPIHVDQANTRPIIGFTRAPVAFQHLGLDDLDEYDPQTGRKVKRVLIPGTMVINCCSRNDLESEHLAWVVAEHIWILRDLLMNKGFYDIGRNIQIGSPSSPGAIVEGDAADEWFCTSLTSPYSFHRASSRSPLDTGVVDAISVRLGYEAGRLIPRGIPQTAQGANPPLLIEERFPPGYAPGVPQPTLPLAPHPLNPAKTVTVRRARTSAFGLRPPGIGNRTFLTLQGPVLPISATAVEQYNLPPVVGATTVKV